MKEYWVFTLSVSAAIYGFFRFFGGHLSNDAKSKVSKWLIGEYDSTWSRQFCIFFDAIFGEKHLSRKCFFRSCIASIIAVILLYFFLGPLLGLLKQRADSDIPLGQVLLIGMLVNLIPDYISLAETRWLLKAFDKVKTFWGHVLVLLLDAVVTGIIIAPAILIYQHFMGIEDGLIHSIAVFSVMAVFFYSTFLTSVWAWLYCLSTGFVKLFNSMFLVRVLDVEEAPHKSIGLVSSALTLSVAFIVSLVVNPGYHVASADGKQTSSNVSFFDRLLCDFFPSTCVKVAGLTDNELEATRILIAGCMGGETQLCIKLSRDAFDSENYIEAARLFEKACKSNDYASCTYLGYLYHQGLGVKPDISRATNLYQLSCNNGFGGACLNLGHMFNDGESVTKNYNQAFKMYLQSCNDGFIIGCINLGLMYERGNGVEQSYTQAIKIYQKLCDSGEAKTCAYLGIMYEQGRGAKQNLTKALELYQLACLGGEQQGCKLLALEMEDEKN